VTRDPRAAACQAPGCGRQRPDDDSHRLYGDNDQQRDMALAAADPLTLPWIAAALARLAEILADLRR
jgi:hypothetical protein